MAGNLSVWYTYNIGLRKRFIGDFGAGMMILRHI